MLQMLKLPDGTVKVLVEGRQRASVNHINEDLRRLFCRRNHARCRPKARPPKVEAMRRALIGQFEQFVKLNKENPAEILSSLSAIDEAGRLADTIAAQLPLKLEQKQDVLEMADIKTRLEHLLAQLESKSTSCRWKSASVAASNGRWKKPARLLP